MRHEVEVLLDEEQEEEAEQEVVELVVEEAESAKGSRPDMHHAAKGAAERERLLRLAFAGTMGSVERPHTAGLKEEAPGCAVAAAEVSASL